MSDSERPHGLQPTRLLHPWDFIGKSTGVGCREASGVSFLYTRRCLTLLFQLCRDFVELRRGFLASSCVGPGKPNLPFELLGRAGDCSRITEGQKRPHLGLFPGPNVPLQGRQGSRGCIPGSPVHGISQARILEWVDISYSRVSSQLRD